MYKRQAHLQATVAERDDALKAAQAEVDLWKGKFETLQEAFQRLGKAPGISPELEAELRRIALVDPNIRVKQTQEGFVVEVGTDILFDSGKIDLKPEGRATIKKIAEVITDEMLNLLAGLGFEGWEKPAIPNPKRRAEIILKHISGRVTKDLERLLLAKETLEQMLIYARYGAKARKADEEKKEGEGG